MFIFGFFKWILIGIIAFIIVIMSSIRTSDWNFPKDEIINAYNTFLQNFCVAGLSKDKDIEGKEFLEQINMLEHIKQNMIM